MQQAGAATTCSRRSWCLTAAAASARQLAALLHLFLPGLCTSTPCLSPMLLPPSLQITVARAYTVDQQLELLAQIGALMAEEPFKLLIVDSIIANFRTEFTGRGELAERQQKLSQTLAIIKRVRVV